MYLLPHIALALFFFTKSAFSLSPYQELYSSPSLTQKNEVIIFYNSLTPCFNCSNIITRIIKLIRHTYLPNTFSFYLIDLKDNPLFISAYKLTPPLNLVAQRINNGLPAGYQKLTYPTLNQTDPISFNQTITEFLNNFFQIYSKLSKN